MLVLNIVWSLILICFTPDGLCIAVTGAPGGVNTASGERPSRQDIYTLSSSGPAFDLFILALQQFQQEDQSDLLSYYQVAGKLSSVLQTVGPVLTSDPGIHGHPFKSWDGVWGDQEAGYCTHQSILLPSWHRPYLALFEVWLPIPSASANQSDLPQQIIWKSAQQIASAYPTSLRTRYQDAAETLRIPYWDWSINATMPSLVNQRRININTPKGEERIRNPLYAYRFHPQPSSSDFPLNSSNVIGGTVKSSRNTTLILYRLPNTLSLCAIPTAKAVLNLSLPTSSCKRMLQPCATLLTA